VDGLSGGSVFAWLYNRLSFAKVRHRPDCERASTRTSY